jgi:pyruvate dehydrogenase E2 component (dihydrolipoamide acetyltransferase)
MSQLIEVKVPDIGDYTDVPVIDICVIVGDVVKVDDALVTLESDKATMDVPSSVAGVVRESASQLGEKMSEGAVVVVIEASEAAGDRVPAAAHTAPARCGSGVRAQQARGLSAASPVEVAPAPAVCAARR